MFEQLTAKLVQVLKEYPAAQYGNKKGTKKKYLKSTDRFQN